MSTRIRVFIDGSNFWNLVLKKLQVKEKDFDFEGFANYLACGRTYVERGKRYYVGTLRAKPGDIVSQRMNDQIELLSTLDRLGWELGTRKLVERTEELVIDWRVDGYRALQAAGIPTPIRYRKQREKGIDIMIAIDLVRGAMDDEYDTAIIVSSDSDLFPAIEMVNKIGKKVEYVGFYIKDTAPLNGMWKNGRTRFQHLLEEENVSSFILASTTSAPPFNGIEMPPDVIQF